MNGIGHFLERPPLEFPHVMPEHAWDSPAKFHAMLQEEDCRLLSAADYFHFGTFYEHLAYSGKLNLLPVMLKHRKEELALAKTIYHPIIQQELHNHPDFFLELSHHLATGTLNLVEEGINGTYFLKNTEDEIEFVIKPEESALTLHNPKKKGSPFKAGSFTVRKFIPLYQTVLTDYLAYRIAKIVGLEEVTPETHLAIVNSEAFFDISSYLEEPLYTEFIRITGPVDKEKLVSVQRFEKAGVCLCTQAQAWIDEGLSDIAIAEKFDQASFERAFLFCLLTADTDAHCANFLTYKVHDHYIIKKIDNSFSFPTRNGEFANFLIFLHNAQQPLSPTILSLIENIPLEVLVQELKKIGMPDRVHALRERIRKIQMLAKRPYITAEGLHKGMQSLQKECDFSQKP